MKKIEAFLHYNSLLLNRSFKEELFPEILKRGDEKKTPIIKTETDNKNCFFNLINQ